MSCACAPYATNFVPRILTEADRLVEVAESDVTKDDLLVRIETDGTRWVHGCCLGGGCRHNTAAFLPKDGQVDVWMRKAAG